MSNPFQQPNPFRSNMSSFGQNNISPFCFPYPPVPEKPGQFPKNPQINTLNSTQQRSQTTCLPVPGIPHIPGIDHLPHIHIPETEKGPFDDIA